MAMQQIRKTHPMVLIAAVALTIFSILGSAAITGLISPANSARMERIDLIEDGNSKIIPEKPGANQTFGSNSQSTSKAESCSHCGKIVSIQPFEQEGDGSGLGAVAGGVAGGVIGNQIGKGRGNTLMTVLGVGGGAYAGHTIEKKMNTTTAYLIKIRMADGSYRSVTQYTEPKYSVGDKVKLVSGQLTAA